MRHFDRRAFLGRSLAGGALATLASTSLASLVQRSGPTSAAQGRKLLTLFLRGGNDALNTIVPTHDPEYYAPTTRPNLALAPGTTLDLGNGAAALHPALAKLKEVHDAGFLASIQRTGYPTPTLSHFSGQQFVETAKPGDYAFIEGWAARWAQCASSGAGLSAVSVSPQLMRQFNGATVLPNVPDLSKYALGAGAANAKLLGNGASGLLSIFASPANAKKYDPLVHETGDVLGASMNELAQIADYTPQPGSFPASYAELAAENLPQTYWALDFFRELKDAVRILKYSSATIVGVELPGFDVHSAQGLLSGAHPDRLAVLGHALRALWIETQLDLWPDFVCLVQSEFGRTSAENGSLGTDHGEAGAMFALGGPVRGGVFNCDPVAWPANATLFSANDKYVAHLTDFRAVLAEVLERHLLLTPSQVDLVIPGWSTLAGPTFTELGFIA